MEFSNPLTVIDFGKQPIGGKFIQKYSISNPCYLEYII